MKYRSTRGAPAASLDDALVQGIAADGGLFVPQPLPAFSVPDFGDASSVHAVAATCLAPYFAGSRLEPHLAEIVAETFTFSLPVTELATDGGNVSMLELFHGPTAAFKDVGARFLAACLSRLEAGAERPLTILVATSGDTGGAVAAAFDRRPGILVALLYPHGRVSARQQQQLTCWSDNVLSLAVDGSFDDCQALVKQAMADGSLNRRYRLSSANSINIGRLLPQTIYYAWAGLRHYRRTGRKPAFVVPTGNLGNALACVMARASGLPIGSIVLATNANRTIGDYLAGSDWLPRASIRTLASAMDVGNPSNMERLRHLFGDAEALAHIVLAESSSDDQIEEEIRAFWRDFGVAICPHTATAARTYRSLSQAARKGEDWILVSTAHPAKFESIVEPLIGTAMPLPDSLAALQARESRFTRIAPQLDALAGQLDRLCGTGDK